MGLLDRFLGRNDPARAWTPEPGLVPDLDLSASALCGVPLGASPDGLRRLGPPENPRPTRDGVYRWYARGLEVQSTDGRLDTVILFWTRDSELPRPYAGRILWKGVPLGFSAATRRADVEAVFGPAFHVQADDDEPVLYYEHGDVEWQIEFAADGGLLEFMATTPGLLADPDWRGRLGVRGAWPPPPLP